MLLLFYDIWLGTVDAVRHYLWLLEEQNVLEFLVLAGDHLYRMDYEKFIQAHRVSDANITFAALPMDEKRATSFGLMKIDEEGRIIEFSEKPKGEKLQATKANDFGSEVIPGATSIGLRMLNADVTRSVIGEGCVIKNCKIHHSVIGLPSSISEFNKNNRI
uniref:Putative nucleotide-diphospho-sugar transferase n=1 Tax=Helianthus annuus TaxID=4232 RepID=A0A251T610_HELAN